jgi:hypothetical protein
MVPIGGVLAAFRFLISLTASGADGLIEFLLELLAMLVLVGFAMLTAFANGHWRLRILALLALALLIGSPFVGHEVYDRFINARDFAVPAANAWRAIFWGFWKSIDKLFPFFTVALIALIDFLALRALGCQLLRPGTMEPSFVDSK